MHSTIDYRYLAKRICKRVVGGSLLIIIGILGLAITDNYAVLTTGKHVAPKADKYIIFVTAGAEGLCYFGRNC